MPKVGRITGKRVLTVPIALGHFHGIFRPVEAFGDNYQPAKRQWQTLSPSALWCVGLLGSGAFAGLACATSAAATVPTVAVSRVAVSTTTVPSVPRAGSASSARSTGSTSGQLRLLTYNVAGLPEWLSPSQPSRNQPLASPLFSPYDLVLTQEDWAYHHLLTEQVTHPFIAVPSERSTSFLGDGLSLFSMYPLGTTKHIAWTHCNGYLTALSDCLADKGFSVTSIRISSTASLDLINLHADAGQQSEDADARRLEFEQLRTYIVREQPGSALIIAGDTNLDLRNQQDSETSQRFAESLGLKDTCEVLHCGDGGIDRVLYRSSSQLQLTAKSHGEDRRFVDSQGQALSDHPAVAVTMNWKEVSWADRKRHTTLAQQALTASLPVQ